MRLLLDTHIVIWWALGDTQLPPSVRTQIDEPDDDLAVSVASIWEVAIKSMASRRVPIGISARGLVETLREADIPLLDVTARQAESIQTLSNAHGDPFDRLLVATAICDGWRLLTHDKQLGAYGPAVILV